MNLKVVDKQTGDPIPFASISGYMGNGVYSGRGIVAGENGVFSIPLDQWILEGVTVLQVSSIGYNTHKFLSTAISDGDELELGKGEIELDNVIVIAKKNKNAIIIIVLIISFILAALAIKK